MTVRAETRKFSVKEYHRMVEAGILGEDDRVELIEGEIIEMPPIGSRHALCVDTLMSTLVQQLAGRAWVRVQNPLRLAGDSEPEPDLVLARLPRERYRHAPPGPHDVILVVEVADSSLIYDRVGKLALYAAASIPEYWIVDLVRNRIEVHRNPGAGGYAATVVVERGGLVSPLTFPDVEISVDILID